MNKKIKSLREQRVFYERIKKLGVPMECALNLILIHRELKDATTVGYNKALAALLRQWKFVFERDTSYLVRRVHGFLENTTRVKLPGSEVVRRLYVGKRIPQETLKALTQGSDYLQGILFGFPVCCIVNYCRKAVRENKGYVEIFEDFIEGIPFENPGVRRLDWRLMGGFVKYFLPVRLTEYIPCAPDCKQSLQLVDRNLEVLAALDRVDYNRVVEALHDSFLVYGPTWDEIGLVRLSDLRETGPAMYEAICKRMLPALIPDNTKIAIKLKPSGKVEIFVNSKRVILSSCDKEIPWSYSFIVPK